MEWWKEKVIYQVYPRSFADGNGDGMGDLKGITSKLDYLKDLGIGGIWLSPHYPSPFLDCGYDIADYCGVGSEYGNIEDFKEFLHEAHKRDIKVILDLVLNHTSDQHPWFIESKSSKDNPKRDWYVWHDNESGTYPNDWQSCFRGPAWTLDETTNEYYYHFFLREQPDLNWRNPDMKKAMFDSMRYWLDLGVDGFRMDAVKSIFEDESLPNQGMTPEEYEEQVGQEANGFLQEELWNHYMRHQISQPELHDLLREIRELTESYGPDRFLVGELSDIEYLGPEGEELHMVFNFPLMAKGFDKKTVLENQKKRLPLHPAKSWQGNTLSNHDVSRIRTKYGDDDINHSTLKHGIFLMMTLKGTPFLYYGEEIGLKDYSPKNIEDYRDLKSVTLYNTLLSKGKTEKEAFKAAVKDTRDRCRTPMAWSNSPNGGFSPEGVKTWLPVDPEYKDGINVEDQLKDENSILNYYKAIIGFRNNSKTLQYGEYEAISNSDEDLLLFRRVYNNETLIIAVNYSDEEKVLPSEYNQLKAVFSNFSKNGTIPAGAALILS